MEEKRKVRGKQGGEERRTKEGRGEGGERYRASRLVPKRRFVRHFGILIGLIVTA